MGVRRALLLQGPMGPFFQRFAAELEQRGIATFKVSFNAGDALYFRGPRHIAYRGKPEQWPSRLEKLLREERIDGIYLFGDGRPLHRASIEVAERLGVKVLVFEEGYLRPDWITLEEGGVNGHSSMSREAQIYRSVPDSGKAAVTHVGLTMRYGGWYSTVYSVALTLGWPLFPRYRHHRPLNAFAEAFRWVRGGARKMVFRARERNVQERLVTQASHRFFLVALQVHCDYQLQHSPFASIEAFIEHVVASFSSAAPRDNVLVIKHHPMDRPYRDYTRLIRDLSAQYKLGERLLYIHDQHLPTLLGHARGTVMINSTVGLQAALQGTPVKTLGSAVYDMPGITHQGTLEEFWRDPGVIDTRVVHGFRTYLLAANQFNGNFYKRLADVHTPTGVRWQP